MALCLNAGAVTLLDEDFQSPTLPNETANPNFAGWTWKSSGSVKSRNPLGSSDVPGDNTNQVIQFEWNNAKANYQ